MERLMPEVTELGKLYSKIILHLLLLVLYRLNTDLMELSSCCVFLLKER
ncbi:hypothetical protein AM593_10215, partial [Mytilus galloprovincialis]